MDDARDEEGRGEDPEYAGEEHEDDFIADQPDDNEEEVSFICSYFLNV